MLAKKIDLLIDTSSNPDVIVVECLPVRWVDGEQKVEDKRVLSLSLKPMRELSKMIPDADDVAKREILDELLLNLFEKDFKDLIPGFLSNEDPIYEHLMERFISGDLREKIYSAYFTEESLFNLKNTLRKIIYGYEL